MDRNIRFRDKIAIVTGGARGIGKAITSRLSEEGASVVIADIEESAAKETVNTITRTGRSVVFVKTDVTSKAAVHKMVAETIDRFGTVDILVNNAGTDIKGRITELSEETWDLLLNLNLKGTFLCTQAVIPAMQKKGYGRIVNISSMAGKTGEAFTSPYCASKFGVIGFTESVALEVGKDNITINAVCPGAVDTDLIKLSISQSAERSGRSFDEELSEKFLKLIPLGRLAQPEDVAQAVAFLASDEAAYITGTTLNVSGGREMH